MSVASREDPRRRLPAVDRLLADPRLADLEGSYGRERVRVQARRALEALRQRLAADPELAAAAAAEALPQTIAQELERRFGRPLRRVLNATGVFLHTNLGRAPLPAGVAARLPELATAACDLEIDLATGRRGDRAERTSRLLAELSGAEAGVAVNNAAGALVLALATLADEGEVIVSRGELVEIGGSFRIPEILVAAGARLVEVGTTNRTHLADYERALGPATALLLKVHASNYRQTGFVAEVAPAELAQLAHRHGLPLLVDEGAGLLAPRPEAQLAGQPSFRGLLAAGCDLVCGSGDKLLGGPQAGLLAGRADLVERCRRHPLYRALRLDRLRAVALDGILRLHLGAAPLPLDRLWPEPAAHRARLERAAAGCGAEIVPAEAFIGGGAAPEAPIPGEALALPGGSARLARLRAGVPPVVGYLRESRLMIDLRTVDPADDEVLVSALRASGD